jgi:hypothetical protein
MEQHMPHDHPHGSKRRYTLFNVLSLICIGCAKLTISAIWKFFDDYFYIFGIVMIILGGFLTFFGIKLFKPTLFIFGFLSMTLFIMVNLWLGFF